MSLIEHAEREFELLGWRRPNDPDDPQNWVCDNVVELLKVFSEQGHSGSSAPYVMGVFEKAARFEPLAPLTGDDNEWMEIGAQEGKLYQNIRCGHVFKDDDGAYDIDGRIFRDPDGCCYTSFKSRVPVTFPYTPTREYVDVDENGDPITPKDKVQEAIDLAVRYGGIDGDHHKNWVIDQIVRVLAEDDYDRIVAEACDGEDGPHTYEWEVGIAP